jgi:hypothetical protein
MSVKEELEKAINLSPVLAEQLQYFRFGHLPPHLATVSEHFAFLAIKLVTVTPCNREQQKCLDLLLAAKDAAVRALAARDPKPGTVVADEPCA